MYRISAVLLLAASVAGCDQGRWIELPPILMTCHDLEDESLKADISDPGKFSLTRGMMQGVCTQSGGGDFLGGVRCHNKAVQIQCQK